MTTYEEEEKQQQQQNRRVDNIADNNPWITETFEDLNRQSSKLADAYITRQLIGEPDGVTSSKVKRDIESLYSVKDETLQRYTIRKIAYDPRVRSDIRDYSKTDDY
jgi:hypothetical protein